jgi:hypothetical protein
MIRTKLFILVLSLVTFTADAQSHQLEVAYGGSIKTQLIKWGLDYTGDANLQGTGVTAVSYEYRIAPMFALGGSYTEQGLNGSYSYAFDFVRDTITFDYQRRSYVLEPKFYYPFNLDKWEFYSSVRLGYKKENLDAKSSNDNVQELLKLTDLVVGGGLNLSLTAVGVNYYPTHYLGLGAAVNVGPTFLFKGGLLVRI